MSPFSDSARRREEEEGYWLMIARDDFSIEYLVVLTKLEWLFMIVYDCFGGQSSSIRRQDVLFFTIVLSYKP